MSQVPIELPDLHDHEALEHVPEMGGGDKGFLSSDGLQGQPEPNIGNVDLRALDQSFLNIAEPGGRRRTW